MRWLWHSLGTVEVQIGGFWGEAFGNLCADLESRYQRFSQRNRCVIKPGGAFIGQDATTRVGAYVAQRDQQSARVATLRKEIAALEAELIDPRIALIDSIQAIARVEGELVRASLPGHLDTELLKNLAPFVSTLAAM
jgi:hypothetical protein